MTLGKHLEEFYKENNIPMDGGCNETSFNFKVFGIKLKLPNPKGCAKRIHYSIVLLLGQPRRDLRCKGRRIFRLVLNKINT